MRVCVRAHPGNAKERLPVHKNLVRFYGGLVMQMFGNVVAVYLMELCEGGSLFDLMAANQYNKIAESRIIDILTQTTEGILVMHQMAPPMIHRDIKIENILIHNGQYKLCDFGSVTTERISGK